MVSKIQILKKFEGGRLQEVAPSNFMGVGFFNRNPFVYNPVKFHIVVCKGKYITTC